MTLIDLAGCTYRRYGGVGFALDFSPVEVEASLATTSSIDFNIPLNERDRQDACNLLSQLTSHLQAAFRIRVISSPPQHAGFGSKTALLLGIATACNGLLAQPFALADVVSLSRRGGVSGVGVNAFIHGGVIFDLGQPNSSVEDFSPSSATTPIVHPPVLARVPFPKNWEVHLLLLDGCTYAGPDEVQFFQRNTPIPEIEVGQVLAAVYHGLAPAFLESDHQLLKRALRDVQSVGFKRREVHAQGQKAVRLLDELNAIANTASGMSSMGPLMYVISPIDASEELRRIVDSIAHRDIAQYLGAVKGRNAGHELSMVEDA